MFTRRIRRYGDLERALGYAFRRPALLERALCHRSYRFEAEDVSADNQRLEFFGDAVLGFLTAHYLYMHVPEQEGVLTAMRSRITSGKALAGIARDIGLGSYIQLGKGEELSGGRERGSLLADALEAVLGAAYEDGGSKAVERVFEKIFVPRLRQLSDDVWAGNPKGELQEVAQRRWKVSPSYRVVKAEGPQHNLSFDVEVVINSDVRATGSGRSKQAAERAAASRLLDSLPEEASDSESGSADGVDKG